MSSSNITQFQPHVALLPTPGMGHLTPFLRLAASHVNLKCKVTLITNHPMVSQAETELLSRFLSAFPQVAEKQVRAPVADRATPESADPFLLQFQAIARSLHLVSPFLSSQAHPLSGLVCDFLLLSGVAPIAKELNIRSYVLSTSSAMCFAFTAHYPTLFDEPALGPELVEISCFGTRIPVSIIVPALLIRDGKMATMTRMVASNIPNSNGFLINTCHKMEPETLEALKKSEHGLPPVFSVMLVPCDFEKSGLLGAPLAWLDEQPAGSVVYVSFGSRSAMSREQVREVGKGLIASGYKFMWVVKDKVIDREDHETLEEVLGAELAENVKGRGYVAREWVDQGAILSHEAVRGFVSHCGWNSVVEAASCGVRMLAWPLGGDQRINAEVVERCGLGMWERSWGWAWEAVVDGEEIGRMIREMMESEALRVKAGEVGRECGRGDHQLQEFFQELKLVKLNSYFE